MQRGKNWMDPVKGGGEEEMKKEEGEECFMDVGGWTPLKVTAMHLDV